MIYEFSRAISKARIKNDLQNVVYGVLALNLSEVMFISVLILWPFPFKALEPYTSYYPSNFIFE